MLDGLAWTSLSIAIKSGWPMRERPRGSMAILARNSGLANGEDDVGRAEAALASDTVESKF